MNAIETLHNILSRETVLADSLLATMQEMQRAIVAFEPAGLMAAIEREEQVLHPLERLEQERVALATAMAGARGVAVTPGQPALAEILAGVPAEAADPVRRAGKQLEEIMTRVHEVNAQNRLLLEHSAGFVRATLRAVTEGYARQLIDQKI